MTVMKNFPIPGGDISVIAKMLGKISRVFYPVIDARINLSVVIYALNSRMHAGQQSHARRIADWRRG